MKNQIVSHKLFELFERNKSKQFIFVEPGGNHGDYLIYKGAEKLAGLAGIKFKPVKHDDFMVSSYLDDAVIYIHGGGGFVPWWGGSVIKELKKAVDSHRGVIIVGPQTFSTDKLFLKREVVDNLGNNRSKEIFIFARDPISYSVLKECLPSWVNLELDHDTALNLNSEDLETNSKSSGYTLYSMREDPEKYAFKNKEYLSIWVDPVNYSKSFEEWVKIHAHAKKIITNRLHSAMAGTILGKETILLPNSYYKNRAIWEFSLKSRGVIWKDELPICLFSRLAEYIPPLKAIVKRSKFQSLIRKIHGFP